MAENQNPPEVQPDIPADEQPPAPVVVDVEAGSAEDAPPPPADGAQPPEQRRPATPRPQVRIQNLTHERDEARDYAARLQRDLEDARREAAEAKAARESAERAGMENYGARVKADLTAAERELMAAEEAGDAAAKVAAQKKLAKAAAQESDYDAWASSQPKPGERQPEQPRPQEQQRQPQQQPPDVPEPVRNFMLENSWFSAVQLDQNGHPLVQNGRMVQNPDYDEALHDAAMLEDKKIQREMRMGKLTKEFMYSDEYFDRIANSVVQQFPDAFEDAQNDSPPPPPTQRRAPPMSQTRQPVAPASRSAPNNTNGNGKQNAGKVTLDGEQAALVRSLVDNGTLKYSHRHTDPSKRGQKMDYKDAYVEYARRMSADRASGNNQ